MVILPIGDYNPVPKSGIIHNRTTETQKQMGAISQKVRKQVRERSGGVCEVKEKCTGAPATEQAHLTGRGTIKHKTTAADLRDSCTPCHRWLDSTGDGVKHKKELKRITPPAP